MSLWLVEGRNRKVGAIGAFERFSALIEAASEEEAVTRARDARYAAGFEHVDRSRARPAAIRLRCPAKSDN